ncbi:hypothetical protein BDQ17DRAFT_1433326 [Cyathus striatus]|nr:hypothetical protein BDQ17DRAFT_1433326 [Cyathus striatus]
MPLLEELFWNNNHFEPETDSNEAISHPSLRTLTLENDYFSYADESPSWSLPMLTGPQFTNLCLVGDFHHFQLLLSAVRSSTSIKCLQLKYGTVLFMLRIIAELDYIEELIIDTECVEHDDLLLHRLIWGSNPDTQQVLPSLRKLRLCAGSKECSYTIPSLMNVMRSRSSAFAETNKGKALPSVPLSSVSLTGKFETDKRSSSLPMTVQLKNLGNELGIEVNVRKLV